MRNAAKRAFALLLSLLLALSLTGCEQAMEQVGEAIGEALEGALEAAQEQTQQETDNPSEKPAQTDPNSDKSSKESDQETHSAGSQSYTFSLESVPTYFGSPFVALNDNQPVFEDVTTTEGFERYSPLDALGRCGAAFANVCPELMPTQERGAIGSVKPTGWQSVKYDTIDGKYLYNRCHLIGYQLTGENANKCNLITGTRSLNVDGMLPFENLVADYVTETKHHVLYRVTPVFVGDELVARGVQMEGWSVEDKGAGVCFNVWCYNVQSGITIDYATGESALTAQLEEEKRSAYILNTAQKRFHRTTCPSVRNIQKDHKKRTTRTRRELIKDGWEPCGRCRP